MRRLLPVSGLLALVLFFFWKMAFTNLILARGDTLLYFYPYWDYGAQTLLAGHLPQWNPYLFMGAPFLANAQAGVFYPLNWPLVVFSAPIAVKISIIAHIFIAGLGVFRLARLWGQSVTGALLSASLFALGGYFTAQVEHINQLQALAWFPWLLLGIHQAQFRLRVLAFVHCAVCISLSLLAGHTQSTFISLVGASLYALVRAFATTPRSPRNLIILSVSLIGAVFLALLLSAAQLLPTLELSQHSLRGGGLAVREALSFSLPPRLLGRALLPGYSRSLFTEFVAYSGLVGLMLMGLGLKRDPTRIALLSLVALGLALALGGFNPAYVLLANVPPFNLFRVPARWLVLFAFGVALLAGFGLDALQQRRGARGLYLSLFLFPVALISLAPLANGLTPAGETGPLGAPHWADWLGWLLPLGLLALITLAPVRWRGLATLALALAELVIAAQRLPFNQLTTPEAYTSIRPAMTQLLIAQHHSPPPRFLSMSALRFDPGDLAELHGELDPQLPPDSVYDAIVATKHKEVLSPNLPLTWRVMAVDGFDGGILPLKHYADFTALFTGAVSADGRLRENLTVTPDPRLLALVNAHYLITDKVNDAWIEDVFYDLQFTLTLAEGESATLARVPRFTATALGLALDSPSGAVAITFADGSIIHYPITQSPLHFNQPLTLTSIALIGPLTVRGLSLIDERSGVFQSLTLGPYRLAHSGDVKIYELLTPLPRAFVVPEAVVITDTLAAQMLLADPTFNPATTVILAEPQRQLSQGPGMTPPPAVVTDYRPEYVRIVANGPGYLVLTDAHYPGWQAMLDGKPVSILRANIMFRAVVLPEGEHVVEFRFAPLSVMLGLWISGLAWALLVIGVVWNYRMNVL